MSPLRPLASLVTLLLVLLAALLDCCRADAATRPPRNVVTFSTAADLVAYDWRAVSSQGQATVVLSGWDTPGDGRGGIFSLAVGATDATNTWDTLVAQSGGTPGGRWKRNSPGNILIAPPFSPSVSQILEPEAYRVFQRSTATNGPITCRVRAAGLTGTEVEVRFNGGGWSSIGGTDAYGIATGMITGAVGQGSFEARVVGTAYALSVAPVSVGDVFAIWGQSNGSGRLTSNQVYTNTTVTASIFGNDYAWKALTDPSDSASGQIDTVSSDSDSEMGSVWPLVANQMVATTGVPLAFVPCTKGASGFFGSPNWNPGGDRYDRSTLFGSALHRTKLTGARAVLWWQGEGGFDDVTGGTYMTPFNAMASAAVEEIPGLKFIPCKLQECVGISSQRLTNGWYAIQRLWNENANCLVGPTLADAPPGSAGNILTEDEGSGSPYYHIKSSTNAAVAAVRWATNLVAHFP